MRSVAALQRKQADVAVRCNNSHSQVHPHSAHTLCLASGASHTALRNKLVQLHHQYCCLTLTVVHHLFVFFCGVG